MTSELKDKSVSENEHVDIAFSNFIQQLLQLYLQVKKTHVLVCDHCQKEFEASILLSSGACRQCLEKISLSEDDFCDQLLEAKTVLVDEIENALTSERAEGITSVAKKVEAVLLQALNLTDASEIAVSRIEKELERRWQREEGWEGNYDSKEHSRLVEKLTRVMITEGLCEVFSLSDWLKKAILSEKINSLFKQKEKS